MKERKTFSNFLSNTEWPWMSAFFSIVFFLCAADQTFTTRFMGFNFRWGQLLLFLFALLVLLDFKKRTKENDWFRESLKKLFLGWAPFLAVYFLAAILSPEIKLTVIKWGWALVNLSLAAVFCLSPRFQKAREAGFLYGTLAIAVLIWCQALVIHWVELPIAHNFGKLDCPITFSFLPAWVPLGFAQWSLFFDNFLMFRPNAFYYEPSYAGAALSLALPLVLFLENKKNLKLPFYSPWIAGAVVLIGSRLGILNLILVYSIALIGFWTRGRKDWATHLAKSLGLSLLLLVVFSLHPGGSRYFRFLAGPLGPGQIISHVQNYQENFDASSARSTEGGRIKELLKVPGEWLDNPILGRGVWGMNSETKGLAGNAANTWAEVLLESGLLGFLAFAGGIFLTMRFALSQKPDSAASLLVLTAWVVQFGVNYNLTQTFPRLDYWLLFFFSVYLLTQSRTKKG